MGLASSARNTNCVGTVHPILARLERLGWFESRWEDTDPHAQGRPRRRYYRLTEDGADRARIALAQARTQISELPALRPRPPGGNRMNTPPPPPNADLLHQLADTLTEIRARVPLSSPSSSPASSPSFSSLPSPLARILAPVLVLVLAFVFARARTRDLALALDLDLALDLACLRELATAADRAHTQIVELLNAVDGERDQGPADKSTVKVTRAAGKVAVVAARLQPAGERTRYGEESAAELWGLAQAGAGRWQQILHATRCPRTTSSPEAGTA